MTQEIIQLEIEKEAGVSLGINKTLEDLKKELSAYLNKLINRDFEKLIYLLYRIDVSETKIKKLLQPVQGQNAGDLMADAIIERQLQKNETRRHFSTAQNSDIPEEDKW